jgi:hypothetical protein
MKNSFNPPFLLKNKHIQTVYSSFFRKIPKHKFDVEKFILSDGDFIECYWYNKQTSKKKRPIVLLFHGLAGSYKSPYIQGTMSELDKNGYDSVVVHFRSCSGVMNDKAISYHSGKTDDALEFIQSVQARFPNNKLFALGYSLGGNMLLKLLGELKDKSPFEAAISISAPLELDTCSDSINIGFSRFYQKYLVNNLNLLLEEKYDKHDMHSIIDLKKDDVKKISTFWEFDEVYTAKVHGFKSARDYYEKSSSKQFLKHIETNTLLIHSLDDPFMTPYIMPSKDEISLHVELEIYPNGGHVGFIEGNLLKPIYWLEKRIVSYFNKYI